MKKRVILCMMIASLILVMIINCFSEEYGTEPYNVINWNDYQNNTVPATWVSQTNPYTLMIDTTQDLSSLEYQTWYFTQYKNSNTNSITVQFGDTYLTITESGNNSYNVYYNTGIVLIPFWDTGYFQYITNMTNPNQIQVLNNQQYTKILNDTTEYTRGYTAGYTAGETEGYNIGYSNGEIDGYNDGYSEGYTEGQIDNANIGEGGARLITAVVEAPVNVFSSMLNFEILGVNVLGFVTACLSICLVFAIIKKVL